MSVEAADLGLTFYGASWCPDSKRLKQFLGEHHIGYKWVDVDRDLKAGEIKKLTGANVIPVLRLADGKLLVNPDNSTLAGQLKVPAAAQTAYQDLTVVGAGPTGMAAAIYTTREDIQTVLLERGIVGGLAAITDTIDNYPGFAEGVSGIELSEAMEKQARRFGADIQTGIEVKAIKDEGKYKRLETSAGQKFTKSVLIATGSDYRKLGIPGEKAYTGRGVHYCATCDGPLYRGKTLIVVGGGNSAMQESIFLSKFATKIIMLVRGPALKGSEILVDKLQSLDSIEIHYNVTTTEIIAKDSRVTGIEGVNSLTGKTVGFNGDGVFVFVGLLPNTSWLKGALKLDDRGFIITDKTFQTSMKGVYAAGDVRAGATLQIAGAVGEGVTAALMIREFLKEEG